MIKLRKQGVLCALQFVLKNFDWLRFSLAMATDVKETGRNLKRLQREVRKQVQNIGIGTKSQQA